MKRRHFMMISLLLAGGPVVGIQSSGASAKDGPDAEALAALRPNLPMKEVELAMGKSWRPLLPHKGGYVDILENSHGIVVRIDTEGKIGEVVFGHQFDKALVIDGLRMGMKLEEALRVMPEMDLKPESQYMRGVRLGVRKYPAGYEIEAKFTLETINRIVFRRIGANYAERTAPPYPPMSGLPGEPFRDPNLKLAVLSALLDAKQIDLGTPGHLAEHVLGRSVDLENEGYELIPEVKAYLERYPLDAELLAKVTKLSLDGGSSIYSYAFYFWDGEDETYTVNDLTGVEKCVNLEVLHLDAIVHRADVRQLAPIPRLRKLSFNCPVDNVESLADLIALEEVKVLDNDIHAQTITTGTRTRSVFEKLKSRGVKVRVAPVSYNADDGPRIFE